MKIMKENIIIDCHYCEYACCENSNSWCDCYCDDGNYFNHEVKDSKKEAEECGLFVYSDIFPKF